MPGTTSGTTSRARSGRAYSSRTPRGICMPSEQGISAPGGGCIKVAMATFSGTGDDGFLVEVVAALSTY